MSRHLKDKAYAQLARLGKALAHAHRIELLDVLAQAPHDVESLARSTARPVASTSQHLQVLAAANLVQRERNGIRVVYSLAPGVGALLASLDEVGMAQLAELPALQAERIRAHPTVDNIDPDDLDELLASDRVTLLDVRPRHEFEHGHLPGAISVPLESLDSMLHALPRDREIVAVCRGRWCTWADEAVERLRAVGFRARRLEGRPVPTGPTELAR